MANVGQQQIRSHVILVHAITVYRLAEASCFLFTTTTFVSSKDTDWYGYIATKPSSTIWTIWPPAQGRKGALYNFYLFIYYSLIYLFNFPFSLIAKSEDKMFSSSTNNPSLSRLPVLFVNHVTRRSHGVLIDSRLKCAALIG